MLKLSELHKTEQVAAPYKKEHNLLSQTVGNKMIFIFFTMYISCVLGLNMEI